MATEPSWTSACIPDQQGRTAVVTGSSAGLGLQVATTLAGHGATVVLACRDLGRGRRAADQIRATHPRARLGVVHLDLASLTSVRAAADEIGSEHPRLNLLINNAGVMEVPRYQRTQDGFELTLATNHLGHFALTGLLLRHLLAMPGSRIVTVSSNAHRRGVIHFDDINLERHYRPADAYAQSKLANLLFSCELDARLRASGTGATAVAAHPGNARTGLWRTSSRLERALISRRIRPVTFWLVQSAERGALPVLRAATDPSAAGGDYYGPGGWRQFTGEPVRVRSSTQSHDRTAAHRLWEMSEQLTAVAYRFSTAGSPG